MSKINTENNASYNFIAPSIPEDADKKVEVVFPTAEVVQAEDGDEITVRRQTTIVKLGGISDDACLTLTPDPANLNVGATVVVNWESDDTARDVTVRSNVSAYEVLFEGIADEEVTKLVMWDGEDFIAIV